MLKPRTPIIVGLIIIVTGSFIATKLGLYDAVPHIDKLFHVAAGIVIAWYFNVLWKDELKVFGPFERVFIMLAMGALIGYFWELIEYSTAQYPLDQLHTLRHYLYGGDLTDTLGDLIADVFGAGLFAILFK